MTMWEFEPRVLREVFKVLKTSAHTRTYCPKTSKDRRIGLRPNIPGFHDPPMTAFWEFPSASSPLPSSSIDGTGSFILL